MVQSIIACWIIFGVLGFHTFVLIVGLTFFALSEICASFTENAARRVPPNTKLQSLFCLKLKVWMFCVCVKLKVWSVKQGENYQVTPVCSSQSTHQAFLREKKTDGKYGFNRKICKWQWITGCFHGEKYLGFMKSGNVIFRTNECKLTKERNV